jgi:Rrf2 family protein
MASVSRKSVLTIQALLDTALNNAGPAKSRVIWHRQQLPDRYLEPVMQELARAGILQGIRGPHGGYRLAKPAEDITLLDIDRVVHKTERKATYCDVEPVSQLGQQLVKPVLTKLQEIWDAKLRAITLRDLMNHVNGRGS